MFHSLEIVQDYRSDTETDDKKSGFAQAYKKVGAA